MEKGSSVEILKKRLQQCVVVCKNYHDVSGPHYFLLLLLLYYYYVDDDNNNNSSSSSNDDNDLRSGTCAACQPDTLFHFVLRP